MSCLFVWACGSEFTLPSSSWCSCASLTQQQDKAAVCKWVSSPGVLQSCQECVSQNAFVIISWKQFLLLFQKKQEIAVCTLILTLWGRGKKYWIKCFSDWRKFVPHWAYKCVQVDLHQSWHVEYREAIYEMILKIAFLSRGVWLLWFE